jgi:hypothetical protein
MSERERAGDIGERPHGRGQDDRPRALGRALGLPVFSKDDLKETLADVLERPEGVGEREWSRRLGAAAGESLWTLPANAGRGAVIHHDGEVGDERWREWVAGARPLGVGVVHRVDTSITVDISGLAAMCETPR